MSADAHEVRLGGPSTGFARWVAVRNSMLFALARVFLARGRFLLHAAAIRRGGGALVVVGDSGTGKSTLAWAASRWGCDVLGDDMVVVDGDASGDDVRVQGVARVPSIPGELAAAEQVEGDELPDDDRGRVELHRFGLDTRACPVVGILRCGHSAGAADLQPLAAHEALQSLVPAFVLSALAEPLRGWFPVAVRLSRLPASAYLHDVAPERRVPAAGPLLDRVLPTGPSVGAVEAQQPNRPETTSSK